jgi:hypothetical protein
MLASADGANNHIGDSARRRHGAAAQSLRPMEAPRIRIGRAITPEQFELLTDEQLARLLPRRVREFFPGKDFCADGTFYLHDGTVWSFYKAGFLDE